MKVTNTIDTDAVKAFEVALFWGKLFFRYFHWKQDVKGYPTREFQLFFK